MIHSSLSSTQETTQRNLAFTIDADLNFQQATRHPIQKLNQVNQYSVIMAPKVKFPPSKAPKLSVLPK